MMGLALSTQPTTGTPARDGVRERLVCSFDFIHGGQAEVGIQFELSGTADAPLLIVAGGISAGRHVLANACDAAAGWWEVQANTFSAWRILAIDWIGADGAFDRPIDAADQARAMLAVLDRLEIGRAHAFVGASYGAMVGMHLAAIAPGRIGRLFAISAAASAHPFTSAQRALQRQAIELGERLGDPGAGVALARKIAVCGYRTPSEFEERFSGPIVIDGARATVPAETYLDAMGERHRARMSAVAYRRLSESIDLHRIDPATIAVPSMFVAIDSDALVPAPSITALARSTPHGRLRSLPSLYGHDAFLKEIPAIAAILGEFLSDPEYPA